MKRRNPVPVQQPKAPPPSKAKIREASASRVAYILGRYDL